MEKKTLRKVQNAELDILIEIDRVCKKNNIDYFLMYGTLLGAVRHKGFIPWDDDIDIAMTRENYDKFLAVADYELEDKYELDCIKNNKKYYLPFVKVRNKLTRFEEKTSKDYDGPKGIWVDIFVLNDTKLSNREGVVFKTKMKILSILYAALTVKSLNFSCGWKIKLISKLTTNKFLIKLIDTITKGKKDAPNLTYYSSTGYSSSFILNKNIFNPVKEIEFEGHKFPCPNDTDTILKFLYKDYMKLPPKDKRISHNPVKIVFEDGETHNFE